MNSSMRAVSSMAVAVMLCLVSAAALAQGLGEAPGVEVDPISFRGPDPSKRFKDIKIEQNLDAQVPLDLRFTDSQGNEVKLGDYFNQGKPVVLSLVYFECPMLCTQILNGKVSALDGMDGSLALGEDYTALTVSIDPGETPELAAEKKANYLDRYHGSGGPSGWHYLVGGQDAIEDLAQAVGYRYYYDPETDQFAHASGIMVLTPSGKISSYYLGIEYLPRNLKLALMDAADGMIGSLADQVILLCFAYDPSRGAYGFYILNAVRLGGGLILAALGIFWGLSFLQERRRRARGQGQSESPGVPDPAQREEPSHTA